MMTSENPCNQALTGYVVYGNNSDRKSAIGVVSETGEAQATAVACPDTLKELLVAIEDRRFFIHRGYDPVAIARATFRNVRAQQIVEGASTITQQAARALMRDNSRTLTRKLKEIISAIRLERLHGKDSILELYFSEVYFGRNNRGIRTASLAYFDKELANLDITELLFLVVLLKGPNHYLAHPAQLCKRMSYYQKTISIGLSVEDSYKRIDLSAIQARGEMFGSFRARSLNALRPSVDHEQAAIITTIDPRIQKLLTSWLRDLDNNVSVVLTRNGSVIACSSWLGPDHPLLFRTNVGSTLKPFLYVILRRLGIPAEKRFHSTTNTLGIRVREAGHFDKSISIKGALYYSNNNAFVNAVAEVGVDVVLNELAKIIKQPLCSFSTASILGATKNGLTLSELAIAYDEFFEDRVDPFKRECGEILENSAFKRLGKWATGFELKTGTTNNNKEHFVVIGLPHKKWRISIMSEGGGKSLFGKEGFVRMITKKVESLVNSVEHYANSIV